MIWRGVKTLVYEIKTAYERGVTLTRTAMRPNFERLQRDAVLPKWSLVISSNSDRLFSSGCLREIMSMEIRVSDAIFSRTPQTQRLKQRLAAKTVAETMDRSRRSLLHPPKNLR